MKRLLIIGAGGFGREVADIALSHPDNGASWTFAGFLDSRSALAAEGKLQGPILGAPDSHKVQPDDLFLCAVDKPADKRTYVGMVQDKGGRFLSLIHPDTDISPSAEIGAGCIVYKYARIGSNARLGDHSCLGYCSGMGHDAVVGSFCQVSGHASINGRVTVEDDVLIGAQGTLYPGIKVGRGAVIGIGSVVLRKVPANATMFGNPATKL